MFDSPNPVSEKVEGKCESIQRILTKAVAPIGQVVEALHEAYKASPAYRSASMLVMESATNVLKSDSPSIRSQHLIQLRRFDELSRRRFVWAIGEMSSAAFDVGAFLVG